MALLTLGLSATAAPALAQKGLDERFQASFREGACELVNNGGVDLDLSYDVPTQAADMAAQIKWLLSSGVKPGAVKGSVYTTLVPITKDTAKVSTTCWNLSDLRK